MERIAAEKEVRLAVSEFCAAADDRLAQSEDALVDDDDCPVCMERAFFWYI